MPWKHSARYGIIRFILFASIFETKNHLESSGRRSCVCLGEFTVIYLSICLIRSDEIVDAVPVACIQCLNGSPVPGQTLRRKRDANGNKTRRLLNAQLQYDSRGQRISRVTQVTNIMILYGCFLNDL